MPGTAIRAFHDLRNSERQCVLAMHLLGFGRFESVPIRNKELVLDPWPMTVRGVKFGTEDAATHRPLPDDFELKRQVVELFAYVRSVDAGEIRCLEVRHGIPFSMEIEHRPQAVGDHRHG